MSEIRAVLNSDSTIKAVLNNDQSVKAVLLSGVTVQQKIDGGEYIHFNVVANGNNQTFTTSALNQYISNTAINLFKNGVYVPPTEFIKTSNNQIQINVPLQTGDSLDILATGSAALVPIANSQPGGTNSQIQFNNVGVLDGSSGLTYDVATETTTANIANVTTLNANIGNIANLQSSNANITNLTVANFNIGTTSFNTLTANTGNFVDINVSNVANINILNANVFSPNTITTNTLTATTANVTTINSNGISNLGSVSNVKITGGTNGYVLQTDGAGNLSWTAQTGGGGGNGTPGGSNTQVQYNDSGVFNGSSSFTFNETSNTLGVTNINSTGNVVAGNLRTNNLQYSNGTPYTFTATPGGTNTQVQFNDNGVLGANSGMTYNKTTQTLTVTNIVGNVVATHVSNGAQPNITSVGTLSGLTVAGTVQATLFQGNGASLNNLNGSNVTGIVPLANYAYYAGNVTIANQPNITSLGTLSSLAVSGNVTAGNVIATMYGSGVGLYNIPGANVTGIVANATYAANSGYATNAGSANSAILATNAQTVTVANQSNITSLGTLTNLTVSGNTDTGVLRTNNLQYSNGSPWVFSTYGNSNVANYLPTYSGTLSPSVLTTSNVQVTGGTIKSVTEGVNIIVSAPTGTNNLDLATNTIHYFTVSTTAPVTVNVRGTSIQTLNAFMSTNQTLTFSVLLTNPVSPGISSTITTFQIDGVTTNVNYISNIPNSSVNGIDVYVYTIIKTGTNSYTVIGNKGTTV